MLICKSKLESVNVIMKTFPCDHISMNGLTFGEINLHTFDRSKVISFISFENYIFQLKIYKKKNGNKNGKRPSLKISQILKRKKYYL